MSFLLHFVFFLLIKNVISCLVGKYISRCLYVALTTSCHFILYLFVLLFQLLLMHILLFYFLLYVYLLMLKIFVVLKRGIFKDLKKKSSGFQSRNPFPILYLREYVASLDQFGGDILIYFIYLCLSYDKKTQTLPRNTLPEIMLTVYQVFFQVRLYPVKAKL